MTCAVMHISALLEDTCVRVTVRYRSHCNYEREPTRYDPGKKKSALADEACDVNVALSSLLMDSYRHTGSDNLPGTTWPHHPQPLPLALLSQSEARREAGLAPSLHRTSSVQGLLGQPLSSSQLSFSGPVGTERLCTGTTQDCPGHYPQRGPQRAVLSLGLSGGGLPYEVLYGKLGLSGRKGFNGCAAGEMDGPGPQPIRTQVRSGRGLCGMSSTLRQT